MSDGPTVCKDIWLQIWGRSLLWKKRKHCKSSVEAKRITSSKRHFWAIPSFSLKHVITGGLIKQLQFLDL